MRYRSIQPLLYFCREREAIRKLKASGAPEPWTTDLILSTYRFCNLRRKDDRVSQWIINNVISRYGEFSHWSFIQFSALCRQINWPPTLIALREAGLWPQKELDLPLIGAVIDGLEGKVYTGAYMIRAPAGPYKGWGKGRYVAEIVVGKSLFDVCEDLIRGIASRRLEEAHRSLASAHGWGSFTAGQVVMDWAYNPSSALACASDRYTWAAIGPGSKRGYNRLLGYPLNSSVCYLEWIVALRRWRGNIIEALGPDYGDLFLMDVQNALCELDKMLRVKNGEGRPRSYYKPETAYV